MIYYLNFFILITLVMSQEDYVYTIFTQECFKTLFQDSIWSSACLMESASRILSILIVVFSILNQMPQIYKIIKFKSVAGVAFNSIYNEVKQFNIIFFNQLKSYLITFNIAYNLHKETSFVLYGENVFVLIQFFIIMVLFYQYDDIIKRRLYFRKGLLYLLINIPLILGYGPDYIFNLTIYINMILLLMSRLPQIIMNIKNKSTGQLAFLTQLQNQAGVITRAFTLYVSSGDWLYTVISYNNPRPQFLRIISQQQQLLRNLAFIIKMIIQIFINEQITFPQFKGNPPLFHAILMLQLKDKQANVDVRNIMIFKSEMIFLRCQQIFKQI